MEAPPIETLRDDLRGLIKGSLHFDDLHRVLYSTDASIFQVKPLGVVVPKDEADVQALVRYAGEHQIPLIPRGAGTGLAGESVGSGLVIDLSQHFREILEISSQTVKVQPGVVLRDLNTALARQGRRFAPDPSLPECTIGGMLATNASGSRSLLHGYTSDHTEQIRMVLDSGDIAIAGQRSIRQTAGETPHAPKGEQPEIPTEEAGRPDIDQGQLRLNDIISSLVPILRQNEALIQASSPRTVYNRFGYRLQGILRNGEVDLPRLLTGSEGTLAIFTEATLRTLPLPGGRAVALLGFSTLDAALKCAHQALPSRPAVCELIDRRLLRLARGSDSIVATQIPAATEAVLLIEYEADTPSQARNSVAELVRRFSRKERLAQIALMATSPGEIEQFWQLRESALPSLYGLRGHEQPLAFIEDIGVPSDALPVFLPRVHELLQKHEMTASYLVHAGTGQVHLRPFLNPQRPGEHSRMWSLADDVANLVFELGGTFSSQHGTGIARTPWISKQYGPLADVFRQIKSIFDPRQILNPGKIVANDFSPRSWPLRSHLADWKPTDSPVQEEQDQPRENPLLIWSGEEIRTEITSCNGCGQCRTHASDHRMCPIFHIDQDEIATPRAKANLMRYLLNPEADPRSMAADATREIADLCVNCKMCRTECPAHVNIPKLMLEAKAANVTRHGLGRLDWVVARAELFARIGSAFAPLANAFISNPIGRWILEKMLGISRSRRLPFFAGQNFIRLARRRGWTRKPVGTSQKVAYFVDTYATYNDPTIAEAVVRVLMHQGIGVYVPPGQKASGMSALACGDVETAREILEQNIRILSDLVREGFIILCSEPTAALMFTKDALDLIDESDVRLVAEHTVEFTSYLLDLHHRGQLKTDFKPVELPLGHHVPCHIKALGKGIAGPAILKLIPGIKVNTIDVGCSGIAGTFGLRATHYEASRAAGRAMLEELEKPKSLFGSTECSSCRLQMEDGSGKRTLHPAQYLALSYGLMPELWDRFQKPIGRQVLR